MKTPPLRTSRRYPVWLYFLVPAFLTECSLFSVTLAGPLVALERYDAGALALGLLGTACGSGYALLALAVGRWLDRTADRRPWLITGALTQIVTALLIPLSPSLPWLIALATAQITLLGFYWAPLWTMMSETVPPGRISRTLGWFNVSWCLGSMTGSFATGWLLTHFGPFAPFYFSAALMTLTLLIVATGRPVMATGEAMAAHPPLRLHPRAGRFKVKAWIALLASFFMASLLIYIFPKLAMAPPLNFSAQAIANLHGLRQGMMLAVFALLGWSAAWHFRRWPFQLAFGLLTVMLIFTAAADRYGWFALAFAGVGLASGLAYVLSAYYSIVAPDSRGASMGVHEAMLSIGATIGPLYGGLVTQLADDARLPFWIALAPMAAVWAGITWAARRIHAGHLISTPADPPRV